MTRTRLRPKHSDEVLKQIYAQPHNHTRWADHWLRVGVTAALTAWVARQFDCTTVADLSAGDGTIVNSLKLPASNVHLGDFAPGYQYTGPIEETIHQIPDVGLFICSETIEHLDDPNTVLYDIGQKAKTLIVSTPIGETADVGNVEHYWGWDVDDVGVMLDSAGWDIVVTNVIDFLGGSTYDYQIHACRRRP